MVETMKVLLFQIGEEKNLTDEQLRNVQMDAYDLLRDHGQALVECMDRAMRYEAVRKMNPPTFTKVYMHNVETNIPFDTLVDTWAFNNGYPSPIDLARTKASAGGGK